MNKKIVIILVGVVIIILAALALWWLNNRAQNQEKPFAVETAELSPSVVPQGLPNNLPMDKGSKVLQNYQSTTTDGRLQATRKITSTKVPQAALDFYVEFFQDLGYKGGYAEAASVPDVQLIAQMVGDKGILMIVARPAAEGQTGSEVEFTLTQSTK